MAQCSMFTQHTGDPVARGIMSTKWSSVSEAQQSSRVSAVEYVRSMRGGSQAKLLRCSDGRYYVVKFQNNPQGLRILANELLAALIAKMLGLPVPQPAIVDVDPELVRHTEELVIDNGWQRVRCCPGLCFGSCYGADEGKPNGEGDVYDWVPPECLGRLGNLSDFAGMLAFDRWVGNADDRQVVFVRRDRALPFKAYMIDNGMCFGGMAWSFRATPKQGLHPHRGTYANVANMAAFEPWVSRIESSVDRQMLREAAGMIPPEWYRHDRHSLSRLLTRLDERRGQLRDLLRATREAAPSFFPVWADDPAMVGLS